jgi:hypothetical protein
MLNFGPLITGITFLEKIDEESYCLSKIKINVCGVCCLVILLKHSKIKFRYPFSSSFKSDLVLTAIIMQSKC